MENSMNSILTLLGIGIGFINGMFWGKLLKLKEINDLQQQLYAQKCLNDDYLEMIAELEEKNESLSKLIENTEEKLESIRSITLTLPPPSSPLARSQPVLRSSSNTSDLSSKD